MQYLPYLVLAIRLFVGGYFLYAAIPKIAEPLVFATSISHYEMLPNWSVNAYALVVPWLEVLVGVGLIIGLKIRTNALITAVMLAMFTIAVAWATVQGLEIDCGCFGDQGGQQVGWFKVFQNLAMIAGCIVMFLKPSSVFSVDGLRGANE